jgi:hypothetical protein
MKFYEIHYYNPNGRKHNKILVYKGTVLFRYKGKLLCYLKSLEKERVGPIIPGEPDEYKSGFIICKNNHLLIGQYYLATNFIDGIKNILGIKPKVKNPFL